MQRGKDDGSKVVRCWLLVARGIWQKSVVLKYKILKYCFFIRAFVASFSVHLCAAVPLWFKNRGGISFVHSWQYLIAP